MQTEYLIAIDEFCANHNIEVSFISSLQQNGGQLQQLEKYIRFYYELDINMEGIETITHLLHRVISLQDEITELRNRLRLYESNE